MVSNGIKNFSACEICLYMCVCGKEYKHSSGLYRHKAKCDYVQDVVDKSETEKLMNPLLILPQERM